jgi:arsenate reductase
MTAHWGMQDPAAAEGTDAQRRRAFLQACVALENRIKIFASLPLSTLHRIRLQEQVDAIGKDAPPPTDAT